MIDFVKQDPDAVRRFVAEGGALEPRVVVFTLFFLLRKAALVDGADLKEKRERESFFVFFCRGRGFFLFESKRREEEKKKK